MSASASPRAPDRPRSPAPTPGTSLRRLPLRDFAIKREAGATGGKILGAGSGGFMLLFCPEEMQRAVRERLSDLLFVPFSFDRSGMQVIHYQPETSSR